MIWEFWQAPDRDSPKTLDFRVSAELSKQLALLLETGLKGGSGTKEADVETATGEALSRPRRWHKIFERMGLLYPGKDGVTHLTDLGKLITQIESIAQRDFRRQLARAAIKVLTRYQLKNPADEDETNQYPDDCDIHPYWAIWKAALELGGKLHWDELNRELFRVLHHSELDDVINRIRRARQETGYDPASGGVESAPLRDRCYQQETAPPGKDPGGQVRDQKTTPWFRRAGFGGLLLEEPGTSGGGYWSIPEDFVDLIREVVSAPPPFRRFESPAEWFPFFGSLDSHESPPLIISEDPFTDHLIEILLERHNVVLYGPPGTGKTYSALSVARAWESIHGNGSIFKISFHPSFGYEDFVQGYRPLRDKPGEFHMTDGILLLACRKAEELAARMPPKKALLIIDEINRGDVARIFGELITYIEPDKRGIPCSLAQSPDKTFSVPPNLYFLGTMNTADKSISLLDVALRRRFAFVECPPDKYAYTRIPGWVTTVGGIPLGEVLEALNERLLAEGIESDRAIGHALLSVQTTTSEPISQLRRRFRFDIHPLLMEYCYMDRARVRRILGELVDTHGRLVSLTDDEFLRILRQITRLNPRSAMISQRTSQLPDEVEGGTGIAMPESELKRPPDSRENA